jgi:hypothetical protein
MYRFKDDMEFGRALLRFRNGIPTVEDFKLINSRVLRNGHQIPPNTRAGCQKNIEREAFNVSTWMKHLEENGEESGMIILADNLSIKRKHEKARSLTDTNTFWTKIGEGGCKVGRARFDPMLKLYYMCPLMMTHNEKVSAGLANGTQGLCMGVKLKPGETVHYRNVNGMRVKSAYASQIDHLLWKVGDDIKMVKPKQYGNLEAQFPVPPEMAGSHGDSWAWVKMNATQIPLISNSAATCHKLQGATLDTLYVPSWHYETNWPCVMLSRVRTLKGLFLGQPLNPNKDYSVPQSLTSLMRSMRRKAADKFDHAVLDMGNSTARKRAATESDSTSTSHHEG